MTEQCGLNRREEKAMAKRMFFRRLLAVSVTCFIFTGQSASAVEAEKDLSNDFVYDFEEDAGVSYAEISDLTEAVIERQNSVYAVEQSVDEIMEINEFDVAEYDADGAYEEVFIEYGMLAEYYNGKTISEMKKDFSRIKVPYITVNGEDAVLIYILENGQLSEGGAIIYGEDAPYLYVAPKIVEEAINEGINENIYDVEYLYSNELYMTLVHITTDSGEYLLPYFEEEYGNLVSGAIYTIDDFFENMNSSFDQNSELKYTDESGGTGSEYGKPQNKTGMWSSAVFLAIAVCVCAGSIWGLCQLKVKRKT